MAGKRRQTDENELMNQPTQFEREWQYPAGSVKAWHRLKDNKMEFQTDHARNQSSANLLIRKTCKNR